MKMLTVTIARLDAAQEAVMRHVQAEKSPGAALMEQARKLARREADPEKAATALYGWVAKLGITDPLVRELCERASRTAIGSARVQARHALTAVASRRTVGAAVAYTEAKGILEQWMVGAKRLGDCTADDLRAEADRLRDIARGYQNRITLYQNLADRVGAKTVRKSMTEAEVSAVVSKIEHDNPAMTAG